MNVEEKERLIKKDIASIENRVRSAFNQGYEMGLKENKEQSGDAISRQMVLEGLRTCYDTETKEYSDGSQWINYEDAVAEMENLPSVKPQPCEDCISRAYIGPIIEELENICVNGDEHVLDLLADIKNAPPVTPQQRTGHCKDCKWWKDSDGLYRRGGHAESQCPINRREVFEGNGYCYMFEPQESEE